MEEVKMREILVTALKLVGPCNEGELVIRQPNGASEIDKIVTFPTVDSRGFIAALKDGTEFRITIKKVHNANINEKENKNG